MIGISLGKFQKMLEKGDDYKGTWLEQMLLLRKSNKKFKTYDIQDLTFAQFVDLENYNEEQNYKDFCSIFVKTKWYQKIFVHNLELILIDYVEQKQKLVDVNMWCFNPPQYGEPEKETIGGEMRKEFVEEFGIYAVLMDRVVKGSIFRYKEVEQWKVSEFFFWANYLSGQQIIEKIK